MRISLFPVSSSRALLLAGFCAAALLSTAAAHAERRCGYYVSSAPDDLVLIDKDTSWSIKSPRQTAGPDAQGTANLPSVNDRRYMFDTDGERVGCACLDVETDPTTAQIKRVFSGEGVPFKRCENDPALPKID